MNFKPNFLYHLETNLDLTDFKQSLKLVKMFIGNLCQNFSQTFHQVILYRHGVYLIKKILIRKHFIWNYEAKILFLTILVGKFQVK